MLYYELIEATKISCIYLLYNRNTSEYYIGCTENLKYRLYQHTFINKKDNYYFIILELISNKLELKEKEYQWYLILKNKINIINNVQKLKDCDIITKEQFLTKVTITSMCWLWNGSTKDGYGILKYKNKSYKAHRISYKLFNGELKNNSVRHLCHNKLCVNPQHLLIGTDRDNALDNHDIILNIDGELKTLREWLNDPIFNNELDYFIVRRRIKYGWNHKDAITLPKYTNHKSKKRLKKEESIKKQKINYIKGNTIRYLYDNWEDKKDLCQYFQISITLLNLILNYQRWYSKNIKIIQIPKDYIIKQNRYIKFYCWDKRFKKRYQIFKLKGQDDIERFKKNYLLYMDNKPNRLTDDERKIIDSIRID